MTALVVCDDLIFTSKITATARANGLAIASVKTATAALAQKENLSAVILDLHTADLEIATFVSAIGCPVIGFGSHVDADRLKGAREAGCRKVMPRSQFVKELESKIGEWVNQPE